MVDWNAIIGEIVTQVLRILLPVVCALIFKWAAELWLKFKAERPDIAQILRIAVEIAVQAAEQIFGNGEGEKKKEYAIAAVEQYLAENGLSLDVSVIADAIEAEVFNEFHRWDHMKIAAEEQIDEPAEDPAEEAPAKS